MKKNLILFLILFLFLFTGLTEAADVNPRAMGMGGAYTGVADDLSAIVYNPAGISDLNFFGADVAVGLGTEGLLDFLDIKELQELVEELDGEPDLDDLQLIINIVPDELKLDLNAFGAAHFRNIAAGVIANNQITTSKNENEAILENHLMAEGVVGFGQEITSPFLNIGAISLGVNLKALHSEYIEYILEYEDNEGVITNKMASGTGFGMDTGLKVKFTNLFHMGLNIDNLFAPEYTIKGEETSIIYNIDNIEGVEQEPEDFSITYEPERLMRVGASVYVPIVNATLAADISNITLDMDEDFNPVTHVGAEKNLLFNLISIRAGFQDSMDGPRIYTGGLGINFLTASVNAAVTTDKNFSEKQQIAISGSIMF